MSSHSLYWFGVILLTPVFWTLFDIGALIAFVLAIVVGAVLWPVFQRLDSMSGGEPAE